MGRPVDRDVNYMKTMFGTTKLVTDYEASRPDFMRLAREGIQKYKDSLVSLASEDLSNSSDMAGSLRNSDDYDDWEYGTEPIPGDPTWTRKPSS